MEAFYPEHSGLGGCFVRRPISYCVDWAHPLRKAVEKARCGSMACMYMVSTLYERHSMVHGGGISVGVSCLLGTWVCNSWLNTIHEVDQTIGPTSALLDKRRARLVVEVFLIVFTKERT